MTTATVERKDPQELPASPKSPIYVCIRCNVPYDWKKSSSMWLKMTYCGFMCEKADLGFTIDDLLRRRKTEA